MSVDQPSDILEAQLSQSIAILLEQKRSQADIKKLEEMTLEVPFFKEYRKEGKEFIHRRCCALMGYQFFNPGEAVFHIDTQGDKFYIILKGTAGVYIRIDKSNQAQSSQSNQPNNTSDPKKEQSNSNPNQSAVSSGNATSVSTTNANQDAANNTANKKPSDLVCVKELHEGQSFGELALLQNKKRLASIICHSACHVATLDKASFHQVLGESEEQKILKEMQFFADLPFFEGWNFNLLKLLYLNSYQKNFSKGQFVFKENTDANAVYFIKSGEFEVFKTFTLNNVKNAMEEDNNEQDNEEYSNWVSARQKKNHQKHNNEEPFDSSNLMFGQKGKYSKGKRKEDSKEDKKEKRSRSTTTANGNKKAEQNDKCQIDKNEQQQLSQSSAAENDSQSDHTRQPSLSSQSSLVSSINKRLRFHTNGKPISESASETIGDRKEVKLCIYTSKELFGEEDIMGQSKRSFGVRCISMTGELIMVKSKDFQNRMMSELRTRQLIKQRCSFKKEQMNQKLSMLHKSLSNYSNYFFAAQQANSGNADGFSGGSPQEENRNPLLLKSLKQHHSKRKIGQGQGGLQQQMSLSKDIQSTALLMEAAAGASENSIDSPNKMNRPSTQIFIRSSRNLKVSQQNINIDQNASSYSNNRNNNSNYLTQPQQSSYASSALNDSHTFINSPTLTHQKSQGMLFQSSRGLQLQQQQQASKNYLACNSPMLGGIDSPMIGLALSKSNSSNCQTVLGNRNIFLKKSSVEEQEHFLMSPSLLASDTPLLSSQTQQHQRPFSPQVVLNLDLNNSNNNNNTPSEAYQTPQGSSSSQPYFRSLKSRLRLSRQNNNEEQHTEVSLCNNHHDNLPSQQLAAEFMMPSIKLIEYPKHDNKDTIPAMMEQNRDTNNGSNLYAAEQLKQKQQPAPTTHQMHKSPRQNTTTPPQQPDLAKLIFPTSCKQKDMPVYQNEMTVSFYRNLRLNYQLKFANSNVQNLKKHIQSSLISSIPNNFEAIDYQQQETKLMSLKTSGSQQLLATTGGASAKRNKNRLSCIEPLAKKEIGGGVVVVATETSRQNDGQSNNSNNNNNDQQNLHPKRNTIQARFSSFLVEQRKQHLMQQTSSSSNCTASGYLLPLRPSSSSHLAESSNLDQKKPISLSKNTRISFTLPNETRDQEEEEYNNNNNNQHDSIVETNESQHNDINQLKNSSYHSKWLSHANNNNTRQQSSSPVIKPRQQYSRFNYNAGTSIRLDMPLLESLSTSESAIIMNNHGSPAAGGATAAAKGCSPSGGSRLSTYNTCGSLTEKQLHLLSQKSEDTSKSSIRNIFEKHYSEKQSSFNNSDTYTQRVLQKSANNKHRPYMGVLNSSNSNAALTQIQQQQQHVSESKTDGYMFAAEVTKNKYNDNNNNNLLRSSFESSSTKASSKILIREKKPAVFRASWDNKSLFQISQKEITINEAQQQLLNKSSSPSSMLVPATSKDHQQQQYQPFPLDLNVFKNFKKPSDRKVISKFEKSLLLPKNTAMNKTASNTLNTFSSS